MKRTYALLLFALPAMIIAGCAQQRIPAAGMTGHDTSAVSDTTLRTAAADRVNSLLTYEQQQGRHLYGKYCSVCHGDEGKGDGFNAFNLDPKPRDFTDPRIMFPLTDDQLLQTITYGGRAVNKSVEMPAWGRRMSREEILYVLSYVRSFAPKQ